MSERIIYLDHAASTPLDTEVFAAMQPFFCDAFYNPSATYLPAVKVRSELENARKRVAGIIGARSSEVIFTAGGSEANNLAIHGVLGMYPEKHMVTTGIEHDSVLKAAQRHDATIVAVPASGVVSIEAVMDAITDDTVIVSVMYANNEIGTVQPIRRIAHELEKVRADRKRSGNTLPVLLHTDAAQAGNYLDLHVSRLGVDLMSVNGSKLYGPKQSGMLYVRAGLTLLPLIDGGGQEMGLRSGTENVAGAVGFSAALEKTSKLRNEEVQRLQELRDAFIDGLRAIHEDIEINGSLKHRLPNNVHVTFPGVDNERLLLRLEQEGILAAAGSACSASADEPSHVLATLGLTDEAARSSVRFTMGRATSEADIAVVLRVLKAILA